MLSKILSIFVSNKEKFRKQVRKEKAQTYLQKQGLSSTPHYKRKHSGKKISLDISLPKHGLLFFYIAGFLISSISIIYILHGGYFQIKQIEIYTPDHISDTNIAYKSLESLRNKNLFLSSKSDITALLRNYQENISHISLDKILPDSIILQVHSFPIVAYIEFPNNKKFFISANGVILPINKDIPIDTDIPLIKTLDTTNDIYAKSAYQQVFGDSELHEILSLISQLTKNILGLEIKEYTLYKTHRELHATTSDDTILIFSTQTDIDTQINNLAIYLKEKPPVRQIYIDFRVETRIFECGYKSEYNCKRNLKYVYNQ